MNIGVLASSRGTNLQAIIDACDAGNLDASVCLVISNNSRSGAMARASLVGVPTRHLSSKTHSDPDSLDIAMTDAFVNANTDLIVTAGFMKKLGPRLLDTYRDRIINVHPSLLPRHGGHGMYGLYVHQAVLDSGDAVTGATVHYVDADYDTGSIILQSEVLVMPDDTAESLAARVLTAEHDLLIKSIRKIGNNPWQSETETRAHPSR